MKRFIFYLLLIFVSLSSSHIWAEEVLFFDNFAGNELKKEWEVIKGNWNIENGRLVNRDGGIITAGLSSWDNYIFSCQVEVKSYTIAFPWIDVLGRYQDENNHYELMITPGENFWYLQEVVDGTGNTLAGHGGLGFRTGEVHKVKLVYAGSQISFYWDDKLISKVERNSFINGRIALKGNKGVETYFDEVKVVKCSVPEGKITFQDTFLSSWEMTNHINEKVVTGKTQHLSKVRYKGKESVKFHYDFNSLKHDALMITKNVDISSGNMVTVAIYGNKSAQQIFVVLKDKSGESLLLKGPGITWGGWKDVQLSTCLIPPKHGLIKPIFWGGDKNKTLDYPITSISIGINDRPDGFIGEGVIYLSKLQILEE